MILIVGATSRVGTRVIPLLLAQGHAVRAMTRTPDAAASEALKKLGAEVVQGDLRDPASLAKVNHIPLPAMRMMRVLAQPVKPMLGLQITGGILMDTEDQTCDMRATLPKYPVKLISLEEITRRMRESIRV